MKRLFAGILSVALCGAAVFGAAACNPKPDPNENNNQQNGQTAEDLKVVAPDGAPALALANAIAEEGKKAEDSFDFKIVNAETITGYVTGANPEADICVLPVNAASKLLGAGTTYRMLGAVTHGNLYFLTTGTNPILTKENFKETLTGKRVGVVQLNNVPGLTFQAVLKDAQAEYEILESAQAEAAADKVNLVAFEPANVTPAAGCDYYLCPEPAATTKINGTADKPNRFIAAGDLQTLYGGEAGYPQAVAVVRASLIETRATEIAAFIGYLEGAKSYLETAEISAIVKNIEDDLEDGVKPSLTAGNLTREVIARCSVWYTASKDCKAEVNEFLAKLRGVNENFTSIPSDAFYYMG